MAHKLCLYPRAQQLGRRSAGNVVCRATCKAPDLVLRAAALAQPDDRDALGAGVMLERQTQPAALVAGQVAVDQNQVWQRALGQCVGCQRVGLAGLQTANIVQCIGQWPSQWPSQCLSQQANRGLRRQKNVHVSPALLGWRPPADRPAQTAGSPWCLVAVRCAAESGRPTAS